MGLVARRLALGPLATYGYACIAPPRSEAGGEVAWYGGSYGLDKKMVALTEWRFGFGLELSWLPSRTSSRGYVARAEALAWQLCYKPITKAITIPYNCYTIVVSNKRALRGMASARARWKSMV